MARGQHHFPLALLVRASLVSLDANGDVVHDLTVHDEHRGEPVVAVQGGFDTRQLVHLVGDEPLETRQRRRCIGLAGHHGSGVTSAVTSPREASRRHVVGHLDTKAHEFAGQLTGNARRQGSAVDRHLEGDLLGEAHPVVQRGGGRLGSGRRHHVQCFPRRGKQSEVHLIDDRHEAGPHDGLRHPRSSGA